MSRSIKISPKYRLNIIMATCVLCSQQLFAQHKQIIKGAGDNNDKE